MGCHACHSAWMLAITHVASRQCHKHADTIAGLVEFNGEEYMVEPATHVEELIDNMSTAFYSLAATGTVRVGRLCKAPQLLACWALELLEEQACHVRPAMWRGTFMRCMMCCRVLFVLAVLMHNPALYVMLCCFLVRPWCGASANWTSNFLSKANPLCRRAWADDR